MMWVYDGSAIKLRASVFRKASFTCGLPTAPQDLDNRVVQDSGRKFCKVDMRCLVMRLRVGSLNIGHVNVRYHHAKHKRRLSTVSAELATVAYWLGELLELQRS